MQKRREKCDQRNLCEFKNFNWSSLSVSWASFSQPSGKSEKETDRSLRRRDILAAFNN